MTTPGGVPNLPAGALTPETMAGTLQDFSLPGIRARAAGRLPTMFNVSNGGNPHADLSPFGILTHLFAGFVHTVANANPSDINGPEDLPGLLHDFVESLPVVGELVGLLDAIMGTYDGDDHVLLTIQELFAPIRKLLQMIGNIHIGLPAFPTPLQVELWFRRLQNIFSPVHVSRVTDAPINLFDDPNLEREDSISPVDGWSRDTSKSAEGVGASAKVVCDGSLKRLFHRTIIDDVVTGHVYNFSAKIETENFTTTDVTAITLSIVEYHDVVVDGEIVRAMGNIVDVATRATGSPTFVALAGNYTVPAGVTALGACFGNIGATGSLWFSALNLHDTGKMPRTYVDGLEAIRQNVQSLFSHVDLTIGPEDFEPGVAVLTAAIDDAGARIKDLLDGLRNGLTLGPATSNVKVDEVTFAVTAVRQKIKDTADQVLTVASLNEKVKNRPWWESPSPFEEVSVPRVLLQPRANLSTSVYEKPSVTLANGALHLIPTRMRDTQIINEVGILSLGDDPPPTALYLGLYSVDPATGGHTLIYDFGDVKGDIDTGPEMLYEQRFQTDHDILGSAGDIFALGILPRGGSFRVAGVMREQIITAFTLYPQSSTEVLSGQTSMPSTVTQSSLDHTFGYRVFASIGQTFTGTPEDETLLTLAETFNVGNTGNWSSPSWLRFLSPVAKFYVSDGQLRGGTTGAATGTANFAASALSTTKLNTDDQSVELTIGDNTWNSSAYGFVTMRGYVRCKADGSTGAVMHVDSNGTASGAARVRIASIGNMIALGTPHATVTGLTAGPGDRFRMDAIGDTYQVYYNDDAIDDAVWQDIGGLVVPVGKTWRHVGFGSGQRTTLGSYYGIAGLDQWVGKDVVAA